MSTLLPPNDDTRPIAVPAALVIPPDGLDIIDAFVGGYLMSTATPSAYDAPVGNVANLRLGPDAASAAANVKIYRDGVLLVWGVDITYVSVVGFTVTDPLVIGQEFRVETPYTA